MTQGKNLEELQKNIQDVSRLYFSLLKKGENVLKGKHLISLSYDSHGTLTNSISTEIDQDLKKRMIHFS